MPYSGLLSSPSGKNNSVFRNANQVYISPIPLDQEGRLAIVSETRGGMRWTRAALLTMAAYPRTAKSRGPDAPTLASSLRKATSAGDGGKKARSPGRARYKP